MIAKTTTTWLAKTYSEVGYWASMTAPLMSALGHKRTFAAQNGMSALPPKADMCGALADVR